MSNSSSNNQIVVKEVIKQSLSTDGTGFTLPEKVALFKGWAIYKSKLPTHADEVFHNFFVKHHNYTKYFQFENGKFNLHSFSNHHHWAMELIGLLIEEGLVDIGKMNMLLFDLVQRHNLKRVKQKDIELFTEVFNENFKKSLQLYLTPTLICAIDKFTSMLNEQFT